MDKYKKFYKTFDKRFKNNDKLILCSKTLSHSRMILLGFYTSDGALGS